MKKSLSAAFIIGVFCMALLLSACGQTPQIEPDENGLMQIQNTYIEACGPMDEDSVKKFAEKLQNLQNDCFRENKVWYAVIPDKSYFAREETAHYIDHGAMTALLAKELPTWNTFELADLLELQDFYLTDAHWRQEKLLPIVDRMGESMDFSINKELFTQQSKDGFKGSYCAWIDSPPQEELIWLESDYTKNALVANFEQTENVLVYDEEKISTAGSYDFFLAGATPLLTIQNPDASSDRELIIFRDSFISSLAPLLLEAYSKITLIDLRFMVSSLLPEYVDFGDSDILFLYSARIINNSALLK